tara:strand:- start:4976 stop:5254 length:279 start_codon:yes stop_codon:yes gene_type:complete
MRLNTQLSTILQRLSDNPEYDLSPSDMDVITRSSLMTETDVANCLAVSKEQLRKWRRLGIQLAYVKIGTNIRYTPLDVLQKIQSSKIHPITA